MLPPGLGFNVVSARALAATASATLPKSYWDWNKTLTSNTDGYFPSTPATNLLFGLQEAVAMLMEEGLDEVFARHARLAEATRRAVQAWGLELLCRNLDQYSSSLTAVQMAHGVNADDFRRIVLDRFGMPLGNGLGQLAGRVFRIGHLGDFNELMLLGSLSGIEMGLAASGIDYQAGGVQAAIDFLSG